MHTTHLKTSQYHLLTRPPNPSASSPAETFPQDKPRFHVLPHEPDVAHSPTTFNHMEAIMEALDTPLTADEMQDLCDYLESLPDAMSFEMMDGFFAALICSPEPAEPGDCLSDVWGDDHVFESEEQATTYSSLAIRHWNGIDAQLRADEGFVPIFLDTGEGYRGNEWAIGFMMGIQNNEESWEDFIDQAGSETLGPVFFLAYETAPDEQLRSGPFTHEQRQELLDDIAICVPVAYNFHHGAGAAGSPAPAPKEHPRRTRNKIGRNAPCPCGSGKKYKKCCGGQ